MILATTRLLQFFFNCSHTVWPILFQAGHKTTWEKLKKYKFLRGAVWSVPLKQQSAIVAQRVLIGIFSLGLRKRLRLPFGDGIKMYY